MNKIKLLPTVVQNKIAAGEVVERPSAVVKELVENSLDAGSTFVSIELEDGGKKLIRIVDNGCGISKEDLPLTVLQHATSKISNADDLFAVRTMGFRGEALASIASVSQFVITSRPHEGEAYALEVNGGISGEIKPAACAEGTIVEARNLFFNTPVRLKFMKTDSAELAKVNEIVSCIALANPSVGFQLTHNGKPIFNMPAGQTIEDRIPLLLPLNLVDELIEVPAFDAGFFKVYGYIGSPYLIRPRRDHQYLFVNGRVVRDKLLQGVVSKIYEGLIPNGKHPVVILFLEIEPSEVDVNVHPTKFEVRFAQPNAIFSGILTACREVLELKSSESTAVHFQPFQADSPLSQLSFNPLPPAPSNPLHPSFSTPTSAPRDFSFHKERSSETDSGIDSLAILKQIYGTTTPTETATRTVAESQTHFDFGVPAAKEPVGVNHAHSIVSPAATENLSCTVISIDKTYLVAVIDSHIVLLDQHALHERIRFDTLKKSFSQGSLGSQQLVVGVSVTLKETEKQALFQHTNEMERLGLMVEDFGPNTILVRGIPADIPDLDIENFFHALLQDFEFSDFSDLNAAGHKLCAILACHSAIRAGDELTLLEKQNLVRYAWANKDLLTCPHGRPAVKIISPKDLAKIFHRT